MKALFKFATAVLVICLCIVVATTTYQIVAGRYFTKSAQSKSHVAVMDLSGVIISSYHFTKQLEELTGRENVKAIVLRINSPGGIVAPSQEMFEALKKADTKKPVVVSMGSLAASGGYYAALGARKIYANPGTLTASIGVIMEFVNTEKLYTWAKVSRYNLTAGKFKDVGSPLRDMKPEEKELLSTMLKDIHIQFRSAVQTRRKLTQAELDSVADGRVMTGNQAFAAKLVDELGGFESAVKEAKELAQIPEDSFVEYPKKNEGMLKELLFGSDENESDSLFSKVSRLLTTAEAYSVTTGWKIMALAPLSF